MKNNKSTGNNYLQDLKEFQGRESLPGYYVGGNLPPYIRYPSRLLGWGLVAMSVPILTVMVIDVAQHGVSEDILQGGSLPVFAMAALTLVAGISVLIRKKKK